MSYTVLTFTFELFLFTLLTLVTDWDLLLLLVNNVLLVESEDVLSVAWIYISLNIPIVFLLQANAMQINAPCKLLKIMNTYQREGTSARVAINPNSHVNPIIVDNFKYSNSLCLSDPFVTTFVAFVILQIAKVVMEKRTVFMRMISKTGRPKKASNAHREVIQHRPSPYPGRSTPSSVVKLSNNDRVIIIPGPPQA